MNPVLILLRIGLVLPSVYHFTTMNTSAFKWAVLLLIEWPFNLHNECMNGAGKWRPLRLPFSCSIHAYTLKSKAINTKKLYDDQ